jgi:hypothetical protein
MQRHLLFVKTHVNFQERIFGFFFLTERTIRWPAWEVRAAASANCNSLLSKNED